MRRGCVHQKDDVDDDDADVVAKLSAEFVVNFAQPATGQFFLALRRGIFSFV